MSRMWKVSFGAIVVGLSLTICSASSFGAGDFSTASNGNNDDSHDQSWYREQAASKPDPKANVQQKAAIRAQQRMDRMASMEWYGMSNSRPLASPTPYMTRYSPLWESPGVTPFSWYPQSRPGYVIYWR